MNASEQPWSPSGTIFVLGSSHRTASLDLRERIAVGPEKIEAFYGRLDQLAGLEEYLVLNTCNRVEIYGVATRSDLRENLLQAFSQLHGIDPARLEPATFWKTHHEVVEHLFNVSAGVDSQMLGETEIFGQVKQSYSGAQERKTVGPVLNRIFQRSFKEAKWARTHTSISRGQISIGNVVVDLATRIFGDLQSSRVLVVGSGEVAIKTVQSLQSRGVLQVTVTSRTFENAHEVAESIGAAVLHFEHFRKHLQEFDIVLTSTSAPSFILSYEDIRTTIRRRAGMPLFLIDTAMPRDVDPRTGELDEVYLYNLDDLSAIANENLQNRKVDLEALQQTFAQRAWQLWLTLIRRG